MNSNEQNFEHSRLIVRYLSGQLTEEEREALVRWVGLSEHNKALFDRITQKEVLETEINHFLSTDKKAAWERIATETGLRQRKTLWGYLAPRYAAAAVLVLLSAVGIWMVFRKGGSDGSDAMVDKLAKPGVILPGKDKAVLTLADGTHILLDEVSDGEIATQENILITKTEDGQLVYTSSGRDQSNEPQESISFNTIATPRGGQYKVVLPDGSKVWLNAASTLRYPTKFTAKERKVVLTGEAYFEVAKVYEGSKTRKKPIPFRVLSEGQQVEVLGTSFNVNSYADEKQIRTTLVEGSVKVIPIKKDSENKSEALVGREVLLKPGEQAALSTGGERQVKLVAQVDMEAIIAWKNGEFQFKEADVYTIMRQISRWYDVEVQFQGTPSDVKFRGRISRDVPITQLFQILQISGVNFKIEGRKIIVES